MEPERQLPVRLLHIGLAGAAADVQHLVRVGITRDARRRSEQHQGGAQKNGAVTPRHPYRDSAPTSLLSA